MVEQEKREKKMEKAVQCAQDLQRGAPLVSMQHTGLRTNQSIFHHNSVKDDIFSSHSGRKSVGDTGVPLALVQTYVELYEAGSCVSEDFRPALTGDMLNLLPADRKKSGFLLSLLARVLRRSTIVEKFLLSTTTSTLLVDRVANNNS